MHDKKRAFLSELKSTVETGKSDPGPETETEGSKGSIRNRFNQILIQIRSSDTFPFKKKTERTTEEKLLDGSDEIVIDALPSDDLRLRRKMHGREYANSLLNRLQKLSVYLGLRN
eukprot:GHVN01088714.1.p1 GENE.GHVN01088714.1~~GHVN01088714.1.p1  ORF type:complete len:115 (-),score=4.73 GHVN01088714.1:256-600(-)